MKITKSSHSCCRTRQPVLRSNQIHAQGNAAMDKPQIQYIVEEAVESGMTDILIITNRGKRLIEDRF